MPASFTYLLILTKFYAREVIINKYFLLMLAIGLSFMVLGTTGVFERFGLTAYPVTYVVLETLNGNFDLFLLIMITFFSGELIWKEREAQLAQLYAVLPIGMWILLFARFLAILLMVALIFVVLFLTGLIIQLNSGQVKVEVGLYLQSLFGIQFGYYAIMTALVFLIHAAVNHKYQAHVLLIIYFFFRATILPQFGFDYHLYLYGADPGMLYSDFFGFSYHQEGFLWFRFYWLVMAVVLLIVTFLIWPVGIEDTLRARFWRAGKRLKRPVLVLLVVLIVSLAGTGGYIFYNTNILNDYKPLPAIYSKEAAYEKLYKVFEEVSQPDISSAFLYTDLFATSRDMRVSGHYYLTNNTATKLDSIHVQVPDNAIVYQTPLRMEESFEVKLLELDRPHDIVLEDRVHNYFILKLTRPLLPQDSVRLNFSLDYTTAGFRNKSDPHLDILSNGTLFYSMYWPRIGYSDNMELGSDRLRTQYGLGPSAPMPPAGSPHVRPAQPISTTLVISSDSGHITVASGELMGKRVEAGRNYSEFKSTTLPGFVSGAYQQRKSWVAGIEVSVLYLAGHGYNVDRFEQAIGKALAYGTRYYGQLPLKQLFFVEYPRYAAHAVSFPGMIAYPELGFIENYEEEVALDRLGRVTTHEVAHQWWGGQLQTDPVQGSTVLTESLAEFVSLMYLKHNGSINEVATHLKASRQSYLRLRGAENDQENPLLYVQGQNYLHYNKGASVFYALQDYLGEEKLNAILRNYYQDYLKKEVRSAHSLELYDYIKRGTPDSLQNTVADLLERITLYELKTNQASFQKLPSGRFELTLKVEVQKLYSDGLGDEEEADLHEWINIGVFSKTGELIYLQKHFFEKRSSVIRLSLPEAPYRAGIDPIGILIDKHFEDNVISVSRVMTRNTQ